MRVLIVDDEEPARRKMRQLLGAEPDVTIAGEAASGVEAVSLIRKIQSDLVFLDIQMPGLDGFGVIAEVGVETMPLVVFVTAYDEHALRAFEVHAFDYLLKPFAAARLGRALKRARRQLAGGAPHCMARRIGRLAETVDEAPRFLRHVLVERESEREALLPVDKIDCLQAERNWVRIFTAEGSYLRRDSLGELEPRLDPERFLRINRSEIVRLDSIAELQPWFHGDYRVVLKDGSTHSWSRRFRSRSKDLF
jgi:two-component system, LytTR family, response regulator